MKLFFEWPLASYKLMQGERGRTFIESTRKPKLAKPNEEALVMALQLLVRDDIKAPLGEIALRVANTMGMLEGKSGRGETEGLEAWELLRWQLREIMKASKWTVKDYGIPTDEGSTTHIENIEVRLLPDPDGGPPMLTMQPKNLAAALRMYAAEKVATGTHLATCENCGTMFLRGGGRGPQTKKRDSRFCEPRCKSAFHNERLRA